MPEPCHDLDMSEQHRSLWLEQAYTGSTDAPVLSGGDHADVAIVGGGYLGLWTALLLKEREPSLDVVIIEKDVCGGGASGRNGGFVLSWWPKLATLIKLAGEREAIELAQASEHAITEIEEACQRYHIDAQFKRGGWLWTAATEVQRGAWKPVVELCESLGVAPFTNLSPEEIARRTGSPVHLEGVFEASAATVHPGYLVRGLVRAAQQLGVRIYEHSPMIELDRRRPAVIRTPNGALTADVVVLAVNAHAAGMRELHRKIVAISSDMVSTPPIVDRLEEIGWTGGESISDSQLQVHYYRTTEDGRIAFGKGGWGIALGARMGASFDRDASRAADVTLDFRRLYPALADVPITHDWSGPIDRSPSGIPLFGNLGGRPHILYGAGFSGNGVGPSRLGGRILADLVLGETDGFAGSALVNGKPGSFPPDPIRYVGAHVVRSGVASKERAEAVGKEPSRFATALARLAPAGMIPKKDADGDH
ncbi:MAG: FAD-dependent oxidoreductase [Thermoleophilia bacterium]|nr:FAD-dependent oxidoreductase [Thermoleophilia bacterium]